MITLTCNHCGCDLQKQNYMLVMMKLIYPSMGLTYPDGLIAHPLQSSPAVRASHLCSTCVADLQLWLSPPQDAPVLPSRRVNDLGGSP